MTIGVISVLTKSPNLPSIGRQETFVATISTLLLDCKHLDGQGTNIQIVHSPKLTWKPRWCPLKGLQSSYGPFWVSMLVSGV